MVRNRKAKLSLLVAAGLLVTAGCASESAPQDASGDTASGDTALVAIDIPQVTVNFVNKPYFDHSQGSIGVEMGFFEDAGITISPDPYGGVVNAGDAVSVFASGRYDVMSASAQLLLPAAESIPPYKAFVLADLFVGYAVMAQPDAGYKSVQEFVDDGLDRGAALSAAAAQLSGKTFAYPSDAAIRGFIDQVFLAGGIEISDVKSLVTDESQTVQAMETGAADFQTGGVPSHLTLGAGGFKSIITSGDVAAAAEASPESSALTAVFYDGWVASDEWLENNHDTVLRLASVSFRINDYILNSTDEALAIHVPFLNSIAGTDFSLDTGRVAYESLHPFLSVDDMVAVFEDENSPLNEKYVLGSAILQAEVSGALPAGKYNVESFSIAKDIFAELMQLRSDAERDILLVKEAIAADAVSDSVQATGYLENAEKFMGYFNYLDSSRFAAAAAALIK